MVELDIAEVAKRTGIAASALRYYEEKGLIVPIGRHGLRRVYDGAVLERLALIALGRVAGFSLEEIAATLTPRGRPKIPRRRLLAKARQLDARIRRMTAVRDGLRHAAQCRAPSHLECPTFRRLMGLAVTGALRAR